MGIPSPIGGGETWGGEHAELRDTYRDRPAAPLGDATGSLLSGRTGSATVAAAMRAIRGRSGAGPTPAVVAATLRSAGAAASRGGFRSRPRRPTFADSSGPHAGHTVALAAAEWSAHPERPAGQAAFFPRRARLGSSREDAPLCERKKFVGGTSGATVPGRDPFHPMDQPQGGSESAGQRAPASWGAARVCHSSPTARRDVHGHRHRHPTQPDADLGVPVAAVLFRAWDGAVEWRGPLHFPCR